MVAVIFLFVLSPLREFLFVSIDLKPVWFSEAILRAFAPCNCLLSINRMVAFALPR
jgi:hypothetical protein